MKINFINELPIITNYVLNNTNKLITDSLLDLRQYNFIEVTQMNRLANNKCTFSVYRTDILYTKIIYRLIILVL